MDHETIRKRFLPSEVRLLLIGESPPAGGTFFYVGDSGLLHYTREAFAIAYDRRVELFDGFLTFFQNQGCFLDDLCHYPINHLDGRARKAAQRGEVAALSERISALRPRSIACFVKGIEPLVCNAISLAGYGLVPFSGLPFPGMSHQRHYVAGLASFLNQLIESGVLPPRRAA